jgi:hypothetical protein
VAGQFYYGRTTGPLTGEASLELIRSYKSAGFEIKPIHRPRIHSKVLGWDDSDIAISSLNWLSADPSNALPYREIGIHVNAPRIAENFFTRFSNSVTS